MRGTGCLHHSRRSRAPDLEAIATAMVAFYLRPSSNKPSLSNSPFLVAITVCPCACTDASGCAGERVRARLWSTCTICLQTTTRVPSTITHILVSTAKSRFPQLGQGHEGRRKLSPILKHDYDSTTTLDSWRSPNPFETIAEGPSHLRVKCSILEHERLLLRNFSLLVNMKVG